MAINYNDIFYPHEREICQIMYPYYSENLDIFMGKYGSGIVSLTLRGGELNLSFQATGIKPPDLILIGIGKGSNWSKFFFQPVESFIPVGLSVFIIYRNIEFSEAMGYVSKIGSRLSQVIDSKLNLIYVNRIYDSYLFILNARLVSIEIIHSFFDYLLNNGFGGFTNLITDTILLESNYVRAFFGLVRDYMDYDLDGDRHEYVPIREITLVVKNLITPVNSLYNFSLKRSLNFQTLMSSQYSNYSSIRIILWRPIIFVSGIKPNNTGFLYSGVLKYVLRASNYSMGPINDISFTFRFLGNISLLINLPSIDISLFLNSVSSTNIILPDHNIRFDNYTFGLSIENDGNNTAYNSVLIIPLPSQLLELYQFLIKKGIIDSIKDAVNVHDFDDATLINLNNFGLEGIGILLRLGNISVGEGISVLYDLLIPNISSIGIYAMKPEPFMIYYPTKTLDKGRALLSIANSLIFNDIGQYFALTFNISNHVISSEGTLSLSFEIRNLFNYEMRNVNIEILANNLDVGFSLRNFKLIDELFLSKVDKNTTILIQETFSHRFIPGRWLISVRISCNVNNRSVVVFGGIRSLVVLPPTKSLLDQFNKKVLPLSYPEINITKTVSLDESRKIMFVEINIMNTGESPAKVVLLDFINASYINSNKGYHGYIGVVFERNNLTFSLSGKKLYTGYVISDISGLHMIRTPIIGIAPNETVIIRYGVYITEKIEDEDIIPALFYYKFGDYIAPNMPSLLNILQLTFPSRGRLSEGKMNHEFGSMQLLAFQGYYISGFTEIKIGAMKPRIVVINESIPIVIMLLASILLIINVYTYKKIKSRNYK